MDLNRIVIVGLGGIGSWLIQFLSKYISTSERYDEILLIDGDKYEHKNINRQFFNKNGPKAEIQSQILDTALKRLECNIIVHSRNNYINEDNILDIIQENDIVLLCLDNHKSRELFFRMATIYKDITIISGGNELIDGNVVVYARKDNRDITPNPLTYHPEITTANDKSPEEMSCEELSKSEPQLAITNIQAASVMISCLYQIDNELFDYKKPEIIFSIIEGISNEMRLIA